MVSWQDFDLEGKAKVPVGFYIALLFLLRGYVLWVISLTYGEDRGLLLSMVYPKLSGFAITLITGVSAVICFALFSLKKHHKSRWYAKFWQGQYWLIAFGLLIDLVVQMWSLTLIKFQGHGIQIVLLLVNVYLLWYWLKASKVKRFFHNWLL